MKQFTTSALFSLLIALAPCSARAQGPVVIESLFLVGDAGKSDKEFIKKIATEAERVAQSTVVFMGDNIYPRGLPDVGDSEYEAAKKNLNIQAKPFVHSSVRTFFIPGNHDWDDTGKDGYKHILNQERHLARILGTGTLRPSSGCPGPDVIHVSKSLYVIVADSMWFLHPYEKPVEGTGTCPFSNADQFVKELKRLAQQVPRSASLVFLSHHPVASASKHGTRGGCPNDLSCSAYQHFLQLLQEAFKETPALVCGAGHEHTLEVRQKPMNGCQWGVVAGTGSYASPIMSSEGLTYGASERGYARLDVYSDHRITLSMVHGDSGQVLYSSTLRER